MTDTPDPAAFIWVDTAIDGEGGRNNVMPLSQFRYPRSARGVFTTWMRYDSGLVAWRESHTNKKGNPTVSGYRGPCLATFAPIDIDRDTPAEALIDARRAFTWLTCHWPIPPESIRISFSGKKGHHLEIPSTLFGGFEPSIATPDRVGHLVRALLAGLDLPLDLSVYEHLRLWRVVDTLHDKVNRYSIPLTPTELLTLDPTAISNMACAPRPKPWLPDDEWSPRPELVDLWAEATCIIETKSTTKKSEPFPEKIRAGNAQRHRALVSMGGTLRHRGLGAAVIGKMLVAFSEALFDPPADESDVLAVAENIAGYPIDDVPSDRLLWAILGGDESEGGSSSNGAETVPPLPSRRGSVTRINIQVVQ